MRRVRTRRTFCLFYANLALSEPEFENLKRRNCYEDEFYWSHQMFVENWTPGIAVIQNEMDDIRVVPPTAG